MTDTATPEADPLDALIDELQRDPDTLTLPDPAAAGRTDRPGHAARFVDNFEAAMRTGTLTGATVDALLPDRMSHRSEFDARWAELPDFQTWDEGLAALAGQIGGTMTGVENYLPIGLGARALNAMGRSGSGLFASVFAGATDAAVANAVIDAGIQAVEIYGGRRDRFDATQLLASVGLGALVGGAAGPLTHAGPKRPAAAGAEPTGAKSTAGAPVGPDGAAPALGAAATDGAPVVPENATAAADAAPIVPENAPAAADAALIVPENAPAAVDGAPVVPENAPAVADGVPIVPENTPVVADGAAAGGPDAAPAPTLGEELQRRAELRAQGADPQAAEASAPDWNGADTLDMIAQRLAPEGHPLAREMARWVTDAPSADIAVRREAALAGRLDDVAEVDDAFGPVLAGYEGRWPDAVARLEELAGGEARGVLHRPELGAIDVPWGSWDPVSGKGMGIVKIVAKHPEIMDEVPRVLAEGRLTAGPTRAVIETDDARLIVSLDYYGQRKTWLLTAYEKHENNQRAGGTIESPDGLQADSHSSSASLAPATLANGDPVVEPPAAPQRKPAGKPARPERLVEFLGRRGGLADEGGELAVMDAGRLFVPRGGPLVRRRGLALDRARELAAEAGYFSPQFGTPEEAGAVTTVRDFLELLDRDIRDRNVYRQADAEALAQWEAVKATETRHHDLKRIVRSIEQDEDFAVMNLDPRTRARMAELIHDERLSADDALERAAMEDYYAEHDRPVSRGEESLDDIPFDPRGRDPGEFRDGDPVGGGSARERGADGGGSPHGDREDASAAAADGAVFPGDRDLPGKAGDQTRKAAALAGGPQRPAAGIAGGGGEPATFTRLKDVSEKLYDLIAVPAVRQGRMKLPGAEGTYDFATGAARIRRQDDFNVIAHEIGHGVQARFGGLAGSGPDALLPVMAAHRAELEALAYAGAKPAHKLEEGFAEWFRFFLTNEKHALVVAPNFTPAFRTFLDRAAPDLPPGLDAVRAAYREWLTQPSGRAVRSGIVSAKRPGWWRRQADSVRRYGLGATIAENMHGAYTALFDVQHPLQRATRGLVKIAAENQGQPITLNVVDDPYKLARLSRNGYGAGHMDLMHGVVPYRGTNPASPSLRDAIIEAMGAPNALGRWDDEQAAVFGSYLWSRRALGEWERFERGEIPNPPDKFTKGDHEVNVRESEAAHPQFVAASAKVHAWALALWQKKRDAGLITAEQHAAGLAIRDYVPGLRALDYDGDAAGAGGRSGDARSGFVQRFRGSTRDVVNPLESLMTDAYQTADAIARNDVIKALDRLALTAGHGSAAIAERIPAREMRMQLVDTLEVLEAAGKQAGLAETDVIALRDMVETLVGDEPARIFRPAVVNTKGEAIVFFRDGGELRALRLADRKFGLDMYGALTSMSAPEKDLFLNLAAISSSTLRAGITSDPGFALANLIRDQTVASILYGSPFKRLKGTFRGMADEVLGREAARRYNAAGGIMGGQEVAALRNGAVERDLSALRKKGWLAQRLAPRNPVELLKGLAEVSEISETGMRLGLFRTFFDEARGRGLAEYEAVMEAAWRARDHLDFDRRGSRMTATARLVPFLNASLQGFDKVTRAMIAPAFRSALTTEDAAARGMAVKAWARLAALTVASLGLYALMKGHPDHDEVSATTRATHWMVKTGRYWTAIPKPFEMAVVLNAAEAGWDAWADADPLAAARYRDGLFQVLAPPNLFEGVPLLKYYFEQKTNTDMFTGRPIVPQALEGLEPWLQYTAATSGLSRALGEALGVRPVMIDQFMTTQVGSVGRMVMALSDLAIGDKPDQGWDEFWATRRFIKSASRGSESTKAFWSLIGATTGRFTQAAATYKVLQATPADAADYIARLDNDRRAFVLMADRPEAVQRLHPLIRARTAVQIISELRRGVSANTVRDHDADWAQLAVSSADRGALDDILADWAMAEARNALIAIGAPGWKMRRPTDTAGFARELEAVSPDVARILADRFATSKVWDRGTVERLWPELRQRLLRDGGDVFVGDLAGEAKVAGPELGGVRIRTRPPKPQVPGLGKEAAAAP